MIIDIHGHYTTAPKALEVWRNRQIAGIANPAQMPKASELSISDDELRESIESNQLRLMRGRNTMTRSLQSSRWWRVCSASASMKLSAVRSVRVGSGSEIGAPRSLL